MTKKLSGKVALVTGGSRGIGAASARALADEGANVAISYVASPDKAEAVVAELKAKGVNARAYKADQASSDGSRSTGEERRQGFRPARHPRQQCRRCRRRRDRRSPIPTPRRWPARTRSTSTASITAIRTASKLMGEGGRIVTIGSGIATRASFPGLADYAATKAAIVGYTKGASRDLGPRGITVNVLQPGSIDTDMNPKDGGDFAEAQRTQHALQRFGTAGRDRGRRRVPRQPAKPRS